MPELSGAAEPAAAPAGVSSSEVSKKVNVTLESTGEAVALTQIMGRMASTRAMIGIRGLVTGTLVKDLCTSPCTFQVNPGVYELEVNAPGVTPASKRFELRTDGSKLRVKPGAAWLWTGGLSVTAAGVAALAFGTIFLLVDNDDFRDFHPLPVMLAGGAVTGVGITMLSFGSTSFQKVGTASPIREPNVARLGLALNGTL